MTTSFKGPVLFRNMLWPLLTTATCFSAAVSCPMEFNLLSWMWEKPAHFRLSWTPFNSPKRTSVWIVLSCASSITMTEYLERRGSNSASLQTCNTEVENFREWQHRQPKTWWWAHEWGSWCWSPNLTRSWPNTQSVNCESESQQCEHSSALFRNPSFFLILSSDSQKSHFYTRSTRNQWSTLCWNGLFESLEIICSSYFSSIMHVLHPCCQMLTWPTVVAGSCNRHQDPLQGFYHICWLLWHKTLHDAENF